MPFRGLADASHLGPVDFDGLSRKFTEMIVCPRRQYDPGPVRKAGNKAFWECDQANSGSGGFRYRIANFIDDSARVVENGRNMRGCSFESGIIHGALPGIVGSGVKDDLGETISE